MDRNPSPGFKRNPGHTITVRPYQGTVTVGFAGAVIATSDRAQLLQEANYPPVLYMPFADIRFDALTPSDTSTHCPYKGDASYWSAGAGGETCRDVMWAYQDPYDEMLAIKDNGAFYPDRVDIRTSGA
ncbi:MULTISPECIES: DUF427 domain-containing protein [Phyllobacteriaceae]|jgi:uncharacterized protein (DUF427 family)|uniref:DUF427 domain-containing protein n=1 Tax=Mesorhizobium hungaricum TaxID=1566387 RepID=A0A1C2DJ86_9HYPH|nr:MULTISPECIES: DUF427 domain-containing protein [Mesorhizobium]MBN9233232.1 DUF427 domain-containing protein [Mesorhizobium sp.]MDQ0332079.1 uncharacterized protein (DUF427 family) [Mesorhizobium sp. YL-MeA3-2017]OCX14834.1 hypothetical protein QV13_20705 [Mesorhizobium hungaricum]